MEIPEVTETRICRVCRSTKLESLFTLGDLYVSDFVPEPVQSGIKAPLEMVLCDECTLLQLRHTAPQELLYARHYWYRSGVTDTMRAALRDITEGVEKLVDLQDGDIVLDIGANDGTLLASYANQNLRLVGCEPANNLVGLLREVTPHVIHGFWERPAFEAMLPGEKARVITAIGMFYDMEEPNAFIKDAADVLADDGVFIAQLMCLRPMLETNDVGNICHEHLEYYSLESLKVLFENNGLEIFRIEENAVNGGSYRLFGRKLDQGSIPLADNFTKEDYMAFFDRCEKNKRDCVEFVRNAAAEGKKVYVYGASTKGNTILQYYGLDHRDIVAAAERSPEKYGKYTVGTLIPIVDEETARADADYFLVLPWAFLDEFLRREQPWRDRGGRFIVPIPEFRVL